MNFIFNCKFHCSKAYIPKLRYKIYKHYNNSVTKIQSNLGWFLPDETWRHIAMVDDEHIPLEINDTTGEVSPRPSTQDSTLYDWPAR